MRKRAFTQGFLASFVLASTLSASALAQPSPYVAAPGRPIASGDDASATAYNPANLAFLPGAELRWTWVRSGASSLSDGHSFDLGLPIVDGFSTAFRLDLLDVERATGPSAAQQWFRWALATNLGDQAAFGTTFGWSFSDRFDLNDRFSVTSALTFRPCACLSLSAVARDWSQKDDRSYGFGLAVRPFHGLRVAELGLEASVRENDRNDVASRATIGVDIPMLGRLRGELGLRDPGGRNDWTGLVGLDLNIGPLQAGAGGIIDSSGGDLGSWATFAVRSFREPGLPLPSRVVRIRLESTPGVRKHTHLLTRLWRLAEDREVDGVLLELRAEPASSLAHAEELGDAIRKLRAHGKKVMCHLEDAGGRSLYVCAQADRIAMNPAGGLRFAGLSSQYMYYGGVLEKLHVKSEFVRIAEHKLAAEQYTLKASSEVGRADHRALLSTVESIYMNDVGGGRRIPVSKLREAIARGPFIAQEAQKEGLVDVLAYEDEIERFVTETMGSRSRVVDDAPSHDAPPVWGSRSKIAVVYLSGDMIDGDSQAIPVLGIKLAGSYTVTKALKKAREDSSIKAVVFRVETGGGSSLAADVILREAQLVAKAKPMIVSMGTAAASGGYYASVSGAPIYANKGTITGSIGIFYGKVDVSGLLGQLGVGLEQFRTAPRADAESLYRPFSEDERRELGVKVKQFYDLFVARVAEGRKMRPEDVDAIARGRVWTGSEAVERKLVDRLAGLREAIEDARSKAGLSADAPVVELPDEEDSLLGMLAKLAGVTAAIPSAQMLGPIVIPPVFLELARGLSPFLVFDGTKPLARMELFGEASYGGLSAVGDDEGP